MQPNPPKEKKEISNKWQKCLTKSFLENKNK
jgi:hypothetical protein